MKTKQPASPLSKKPRKTRSDKGYPQLTQRDLDMLRRIGEQTAYRFDQLQKALAHHPQSQSQDPDYLSETRTSAIIERWKRLGLADYRKIRYDEPGWIWLTYKGLHHLDLRIRFLDPYRSDLNHLFWANETRVLVEAEYGMQPGFYWESERQYRVIREQYKAQQKQEPLTQVPREYRSPHRPDAIVRYRQTPDLDAPEIIMAIEAEISEKSYKKWTDIFIDLTIFFTEAHYYVAPDIKPLLTKALEKFQAHEDLHKQRQNIFLHDLTYND